MSSNATKRKNAGDGSAKRKQRKSKQNDDNLSDDEFDNFSDGSGDNIKDSEDAKDDIDDLLGEDSGLVSTEFETDAMLLPKFEYRSFSAWQRKRARKKN